MLCNYYYKSKPIWSGDKVRTIQCSICSLQQWGFGTSCTPCRISYEACEAWASGPLQSSGPQHESWHSIQL